MCLCDSCDINSEAKWKLKVPCNIPLPTNSSHYYVYMLLSTYRYCTLNNRLMIMRSLLQADSSTHVDIWERLFILGLLVWSATKCKYLPLFSSLSLPLFLSPSPSLPPSLPFPLSLSLPLSFSSKFLHLHCIALISPSISLLGLLYYKRAPDYFPTLHRKRVGCFKVPVVHSTMLIDLQVDNSKRLQYWPQPDGFTGPVDDTVQFAYSAKKEGDYLVIALAGSQLPHPF